MGRIAIVMQSMVLSGKTNSLHQKREYSINKRTSNSNNSPTKSRSLIANHIWGPGATRQKNEQPDINVKLPTHFLFNQLFSLNRKFNKNNKQSYFYPKPILYHQRDILNKESLYIQLKEREKRGE